MSRRLVSLFALGLLVASIGLLAPTSEAAGPWTCGGSSYFNDPATEIVQNPGFEADLASWYTLPPVSPPTISTTTFHSGAKSARVLSVGGAQNAVQDLSAPPAVHVMTYWFHVATWGPGAAFAVETLANWNPVFGTADIETQLYWVPPNTMFWRIWTRNGGPDTMQTYPRTLTTGAWHLLETVIDGTRGIQCLFIDGTYVDSLSVSAASTFAPTVIAFGDISTAGDAGTAYYDDFSIQSASVPLPDYVPTSPQPSSGIQVGESLPVSLRIGVVNSGSVAANTSSTVTFFNASTPGSPFASFSIPPLAASEVAGPFTATWVSPSAPGTYQIVAEVDSGGTVPEVNEANNRYVWTANVYPPPITSLNLGVPNYAGTYVTSSTPLTLTVQDRSGTGIARTEYHIDSGPWTPYTAPFTLAPEGEHVVGWYSEDNVGNVEAVQTRTLRADNTPPTTSHAISGPSYSGGFVTSQTRFSLTTTDGGVFPVGVATLEYSFDGLTWIPYSIPFSVSGGEGPRTLYYGGTDLLGNPEPVQTVPLIIDDSPPTTSYAVFGPTYTGGFVTSQTLFSLTTTDGGVVPVGVATLEYSFDGLTWIAYTNPISLLGAEGPRTLYFRSTDLLGNSESVQALPLILDNTPPATSREVSGPTHTGGFVTSETLFSLTTVDGGVVPVGVATLEYSFDGLTWTPYTVPFGASGDDGPRTLYYRGTDLLGNAEPVQTLSIILDNTPPTTSLAIPSGILSVESRFTLSATDAGSGVARIEYSIDGGAWATYDRPFFLGVGDHTIRYRSVDRLGTAEPVQFVLVRIDNMKPLVAVAFSLVLLAFGVAVALRRPLSSDPRRRSKAFLIGTFPFVVGEAMTGIFSAVTGALVIPPVLDVGMLVDGLIFALGLAVPIPVSRRVRRTP